ncbi:hypothetical protein [Pseudoalteromonas phage vB_PalP_Y7]|nr:hypothetical protein [Pseudoalteromonas phage vB_PalP_Y7]
MRNRKRSYNSKPFLVIGGPHDGQTVNVLAAPLAPIENVIRLPVPRKNSVADFMPAAIVQPRQQDQVIEYYVHQVRRVIPNTGKPWLEPVVESYWLYHVDKVMTGWEEDIHVIFSRLREFYKELA